jgi:hypothetical protein
LGKKTKQTTPASGAATKINVLLIVGAVVLAAGIIWYSLRPTPVVQREVLPKPNVVTVDPAKFTGKTGLAYAVAKEIPEVLAQLPCYCGCMSGHGHKSNLDCFRDEHGVECSMCQDIALDARNMWEDGVEIVRIREKIKEKYSRLASLPH